MEAAATVVATAAEAVGPFQEERAGLAAEEVVATVGAETDEVVKEVE